MKFSYVALNSKYQKVTGNITAEDENAAKNELHKMGLSVLEIAKVESSEERVNSADTKIFWFLVRDQQGQESSGTIEAEHRKTAYRRLISEYKFEIIALCENNVPEEQREKIGKEGLEAIATELEEEGYILPQKQQQALTDAGDEGAIALANERFQQQKQQIMKEVDTVTKKAEEILEKHHEKMSGEEFRSIKNTLDTLMRIKLSNNIPYIQELTEELFEGVQKAMLKYAQRAISDEEEVSAVRQKNLKEKIENATEKNIEYTASQNASTLQQLKSVSKRLNALAKKGGVGALWKFPVKSKPSEKSTPISQQKRKRKFSFQSLQPLFAQDKTTRQHAWEKLFSFFHTPKEKSTTAQVDSRTSFLHTIGLIVQEIRFILGWLLAFYTVFFLFAEYALLKGFTPVLPFLERLFSTPFLLFFSVFLLCTAAIFSAWHYFFRHSVLVLIFSSMLFWGFFVIFVVNF